jgi:hypothetical protein
MKRALLIHLGEQKSRYAMVNAAICGGVFEESDPVDVLDCNTLDEAPEINKDTDFVIVSYSLDAQGKHSIDIAQVADAYKQLEAGDKPEKKVDMAYEVFALAREADIPLHVCALDEAVIDEKVGQMSLMELKAWTSDLGLPGGNVFAEDQKILRLKPEFGSSRRSKDLCFDDKHYEQEDKADRCRVYHLPSVALPPLPKTQKLDVVAVCNVWTFIALKKAFEGHAEGQSCIYCAILHIEAVQFGCPYCGGKKKKQGEEFGARLGGSLEFGGCATTDKTHPASMRAKVKMFRD